MTILHGVDERKRTCGQPHVALPIVELHIMRFKRSFFDSPKGFALILSFSAFSLSLSLSRWLVAAG